MNHTSSYWIDSTSSTSYPPLNDDISTDVLVIGGGITGITTAFELQNEGLRTVLIESDKDSKAILLNFFILTINHVTYTTIMVNSI